MSITAKNKAFWARRNPRDHAFVAQCLARNSTVMRWKLSYGRAGNGLQLAAQTPLQHSMDSFHEQLSPWMGFG